MHSNIIAGVYGLLAVSSCHAAAVQSHPAALAATLRNTTATTTTSAAPSNTLTNVCGLAPTVAQYMRNPQLQGPSDDQMYGGLRNVYGFHMMDWSTSESILASASAVGMNKSTTPDPYSSAIRIEAGSYAKPPTLLRQSSLWQDDMELQGPGYYVFSLTWDMWCGEKYGCKAYFAPGGPWVQTIASTSTGNSHRSLSGMKTSRFVKYDQGDAGYGAAIYFEAAVPQSVKSVTAGTIFGALYLANVTFLGPYKTVQQANACATFDEDRLVTAELPTPLPPKNVTTNPPKQWITNPTFSPNTSGQKDTLNVAGYKFPGWDTNSKIQSLGYINPKIPSAVDSRNITGRHAALFQSLTHDGQKYVNISQRLQDFSAQSIGYYALAVSFDHSCTGTYPCVGSVYVPNSGFSVLFSTGKAVSAGPQLYHTSFYVGYRGVTDSVGVRFATSRLADPNAPALPKNTVLGSMDVYGLVIYGPYSSQAKAQAATDYMNILG